MKQPRNGVQKWDRSPELMAVSRGITRFWKDVFRHLFPLDFRGIPWILDKATTNRGVEPLGNSRGAPQAPLCSFLSIWGSCLKIETMFFQPKNLILLDINDWILLEPRSSVKPPIYYGGVIGIYRGWSALPGSVSQMGCHRNSWFTH